MILTGHTVSGEEAFVMGLANRLAERGKAREEAETLAARITAFPQSCMRSDRRAVYVGFDLPIDDAMELEFRLGMEVIAGGERQKGMKLFSQGTGKHGRF